MAIDTALLQKSQILFTKITVLCFHCIKEEPDHLVQKYTVTIVHSIIQNLLAYVYMTIITISQCSALHKTLTQNILYKLIMTYYVAESLRSNNRGDRICINENLEYRWFSPTEQLDPYHLLHPDNDFSYTIQLWLTNLSTNNMQLLFSFTEQSHPELFI